MVGDFGFDPLSLGSDAEMLRWFREAELQHCRWAMLGVAGTLVGEIVRPDISFFSAPQQLTTPINIATLIAIQFILFHYVEIRRWQDFRNPGSMDQDPIFKNNKLSAHEVGYPGGIFDPMGMSKGNNLNELKLKELKNGRLAMVAFAGFIAASQYNGGANPLALLGKHVADPGHNTIFTAWSH